MLHKRPLPHNEFLRILRTRPKVQIGAPRFPHDWNAVQKRPLLNIREFTVRSTFPLQMHDTGTQILQKYAYLPD